MPDGSLELWFALPFTAKSEVSLFFRVKQKSLVPVIKLSVTNKNHGGFDYESHGY
ncbi:MAG: hypothetical protein WCI64_10525 [Chlorobium sp.]